MTSELKDLINPNSTNSDVINVIINERQKILINTMQVLRNRLERYGISQINILPIRRIPGRFSIELSGNYDDSINYETNKRVWNLLRNSGKLEFWETYGKSEIYTIILNADKKLSELRKYQNLTFGLSKDIPSNSTLLYFLKNTEPNSTNDPIIGSSHFKDSAIVNYCLNLPQIKAIFPRNLLFQWNLKPIDVQEKTYTLNALKISSRDGNALLDRKTVKDIKSNKSNILEITLNSEGANIWRKLTYDNVGKKIAVVYNNKVLSFISVENEIKNGICSFESDLIREDIEDIVNIIKSGQLPASVEIIGSDYIGK